MCESGAAGKRFAPFDRLSNPSDFFSDSNLRLRIFPMSSPRVMVQCAVFQKVRMRHYAHPIKRQKQQAPPGTRGRGDDAREDREHASQHEDCPEEPMPLVDLAEAGNDAQAEGDSIAEGPSRFTAAVSAHPVAFGALVEIVGVQRGLAKRALLEFGERRIGVGGRHV